MADGRNAASNQFPSDDVGSTSGASNWRAGQPAPSRSAPEPTTYTAEMQVHEIDITKYGACYDPNYKDGQAEDNPLAKEDYDQD